MTVIFHGHACPGMPVHQTDAPDWCRANVLEENVSGGGDGAPRGLCMPHE